MSELSQCVIIPVYNHGPAVISVIAALRAGGAFPVIVVDDGSDGETKSALGEAASAFAKVTLVTREKNGGKGAAVIAGLEKAREMGFSHALQIDADGQHDAGRARFFFDESAKQPEAVVCGLPVFDQTAPAVRRKGRGISNTWAKIVTLSGALPDVLCGFRVYPVETVLRLVRACHLDRRMGFDAEILVRLYWQGTPMAFYPLKVIYPEHNLSNFRFFRDNVRISWVFTRLFFGMLLRFPSLLGRKK